MLFRNIAVNLSVFKKSKDQSTDNGENVFEKYEKYK